MVNTPGFLAQSVASPTADPGIAGSILAWSHTFVVIDHEIICTVILHLPLVQEGLLSLTSNSLCTNLLVKEHERLQIDSPARGKRLPPAHHMVTWSMQEAF